MGVESAYEHFVHARSRALLRTAMLLTGGDRPAAEDLLQTALTKAFLSWRKLRDPAAAEAYVRRILVNSAINEGRRRRRRPEVLHAQVPDPDEGRDGEDQATRIGIWQELNLLSPQQRAVLVLRYYEGLSEAEIARILGCAPGTVKSHASRGLDLLRSRWTATDFDVSADSRATGGGR